MQELAYVCRSDAEGNQRQPLSQAQTLTAATIWSGQPRQVRPGLAMKQRSVQIVMDFLPSPLVTRTKSRTPSLHRSSAGNINTVPRTKALEIRWILTALLAGGACPVAERFRGVICSLMIAFMRRGWIRHEDRLQQ